MSAIWNALTPEQKHRIAGAAYVSWNYKSRPEAGLESWGRMDGYVKDTWSTGISAVFDELEKVSNGE